MDFDIVVRTIEAQGIATQPGTTSGWMSIPSWNDP
jgi:hypothetical protein